MKKYFYFLLFAIHFVAIAQHNPDYTIFNYNLNLANPAFAGKNGKTQLATNFKKMWAGVENSLNTSIISFTTPFGNGVGLGLNVVRDDFYLFNETIASVDLSYSVKLNQHNDLLFGIEAQGAFFNADLSRINTQTVNDPLFTRTNNNFNPNFSIGVALKNEKYFAHIAILDVLKHNRFSRNSDLETEDNYFKINTGGGFSMDLNDKLSLNTMALVRITQSAPLSFDVTSMLDINKKFDIGLTYRWKNAVMANLFFNATSWAQLGYSYGLSVNELSRYNGGSYEFFIRIHFDKQTKESKKRVQKRAPYIN